MHTVYLRASVTGPLLTPHSLTVMAFPMQAAVSQLGERPKEEASAQAWDMHYNAVDATAHDAAARDYPDAETQNAWERYLHREQLLVLRDQLIQYGGARERSLAARRSSACRFPLAVSLGRQCF